MNAATPVLDGLIGAIDSVEEFGGPSNAPEGSVGRGGLLIIRGWALGPTRSPVNDLVVRVGDEGTLAATHILRDDLVPQFGDQAVGGGFLAVLSVKVAEGRYPIAISATIDGADYQRVFDLHVDVTRPANPLRDLHPRQAGWNFSVDGVRLENDDLLPRDKFGAYIVDYRELTAIRLWAIDTVTRRPPRAVIARMGGMYLPVADGYRRSDAASLVGIPGAANCGYRVAVTPSIAGTAVVELFAVAYDRSVAHLGDVLLRGAEHVPLSALSSASTIEGALDRVSVDDATSEYSGNDVKISIGDIVDFHGWCIDTVGPRLSGGFEIDGLPAGAGQLWSRMPRPDVASLHHDDALVDCGFRLRLDTSSLRAGRYQIRLRALSAGLDAVGSIGPEIVVIVRPAA